MKYLIFIFFIFVSFFTIKIILISEFNTYLFILFTLVSNMYFLISLSKKVNCFHVFMSFFLWMGFWLKFVISFFFFDLNFYEISNYQTSKDHIDSVILISTVGISGFFFSGLINYKIFTFKYNLSKYKNNIEKISIFFVKGRMIIQICLALTVFIVTFLNFKYSIYQRGIISQFDIGFFTSSIFKWLLLFGFSSFFSILIFSTLYKKRKIHINIFLFAITENFLSSLSMLSRGMFVNFMALIVGLYRFHQNYKLKKFSKKIILLSFFFLILFIVSISAVKDLREKIYFDKMESQHENINDVTAKANTILEIDEIISLISHRFVGIESVSSVVSYGDLNFDLLKMSLLENQIMDNKGDTFFSSFIKNENKTDTQNIDKKELFFIKVPGIIAYIFYSGSYVFLFCVTLFLGLVITMIEKLVIKFSFGNIIFSSLISQVLAYRLSNFGYLPQNSYLILLTIILNIIVIYLICYILKKKLN